VVPSRSQQAGLAAAIALNVDRSAAVNADAMAAALDAVRTGGVAPAARQDPEGRFAIGDAVGYVGDDLVAWGEPGATLEAVLSRLGRDAELLTCIRGEGAPLDEDAVTALMPDGVELELEDGGQPSWWWLLAAE
jgi:dihydroxyacetone kinase-like predicted kinase